MVPVLVAELVAAFGPGVVAGAAAQVPAGQQVRFLIRRLQALGLALRPAVVGILAGDGAVGGLGPGRAGAPGQA